MYWIVSLLCVCLRMLRIPKKRQVTRIVHFVRNGEKFTRLTGVREVLQLSEIATKNVGDNALNPRMKYIIVRLYN